MKLRKREAAKVKGHQGDRGDQGFRGDQDYLGHQGNDKLDKLGILDTPGELDILDALGNLGKEIPVLVTVQ